MRASPASRFELFVATSERSADGHRLRASQASTLTVTRIGYLVPGTDFDGIVHSVFARACNIAGECGILTIAAAELADGPTVLRLGPDAPVDLRPLFRPGERIRRRQGVASTRGIVLNLVDAAIWRPARPPPASSERLTANLRLAAAALERRRRTGSSVIDREAGESLGTLEAACRRLDLDHATAEIHRLVGWGEGLTPAGDDAIVGLLASLGGLARGQADRLRFLRSLSAAVTARVERTTVISGRYLRLAAQGHFNGDVARLRNALLGDETDGVAVALEAALAVGATSGADMVTGMIAGFSAWSGAVVDHSGATAAPHAEVVLVPG